MSSLTAEDKRMAAVIMLDQTAAFDLVDHRTLLQQMHLLNFNSNTLAWFRSYLGEMVLGEGGEQHKWVTATG